jgi:hypothetical protein
MDEVLQCATCGKSVCTTHQAVCVVCPADNQVHCSQHLRRTDQSERLVCARHVAACALEPPPTAVFAADEVEACPICGKAVCARHRAACGYCGRQVCTADLGPLDPAKKSRRCSTCAQLAAVSALPDAAVTALRAAGAEGKSSRRWRMARDRSHLVLELDLGLTRKTVFALRHGSDVPDSVVMHSLLSAIRRR